jgi:hypothetical protein
VSRNLVGQRPMPRSGPWRLVAVPETYTEGQVMAEPSGPRRKSRTAWLDPKARRPPQTPKHLRKKGPRPGRAVWLEPALEVVLPGKRGVSP